MPVGLVDESRTSVHNTARVDPSTQKAPTVQLVQSVAASALGAPRNVPAGHRFAVALLLPAGQKWPAAHAPLHWSSTLPGSLPYRPAAHGRGAVERSPQNVDAGQVSHAVPPALDWYEPPGHGEQTLRPATAAIVPFSHGAQGKEPPMEAVPAGQSTHASRPSARSMPAVQLMHEPPTVPIVFFGHSMQLSANGSRTEKLGQEKQAPLSA